MKRVLKIAVICGIVIILGVSFKMLVSNGTFSCAAENVVKEAPKAPAAEPAVVAVEPKAAPEAKTETSETHG